MFQFSTKRKHREWGAVYKWRHKREGAQDFMDFPKQKNIFSTSSFLLPNRDTILPILL